MLKNIFIQFIKAERQRCLNECTHTQTGWMHDESKIKETILQY